jgi:hypothetical protein
MQAAANDGFEPKLSDAATCTNDREGREPDFRCGLHQGQFCPGSGLWKFFRTVKTGPWTELRGSAVGARTPDIRCKHKIEDGSTAAAWAKHTFIRTAKKLS